MSRSLLDVLRNVTLDPGEQAAFTADPAGYLAQYGYQDVPAEDLSEAFSLVADTLPADVARAISPESLAGASYGAVGEGFGAELATGPDVSAEPEATSFGQVNQDFDDDAGEGLSGFGSADQATEAVEAGEPGEAPFGFGDGSAYDAGFDSLGDQSDTAFGVEPGFDDPGLGDETADTFDGGFSSEDVDLEPAAEFGAGDDGGFDSGEAVDDDLGLDLTDPADGIDDVGAF